MNVIKPLRGPSISSGLQVTSRLLTLSPIMPFEVMSVLEYLSPRCLTTSVCIQGLFFKKGKIVKIDPGVVVASALSKRGAAAGKRFQWRADPV